LLARGDTLGVFQLDGGGMRTLLRLMQPDNFEDISAALALYRPGRWAWTPHQLRPAQERQTADHPLDPPRARPAARALEPILGNRPTA
jgi:DNA polymerase-3 subunit alpha